MFGSGLGQGIPPYVAAPAFTMGIGAGTFALPYVGLQFKFMQFLGNQQPIAAIGCALVGVSLILFGGRRG